MREKSKPICKTEDIRDLLIDYLLKYSVRKEMCLPVLLMIGESRRAMLDLMVFIKDNNPTEHEIIQKTMELEEMLSSIPGR